MPDDRTKTALTRQLRGLDLDTFEVTILREDDHRSVNLWSVETILERLPNLKRANKAGANLYVRAPRDRDHDLILLDDLDRFTPDKMKSAGHAPAVVVETSPGNVQAWVRLGEPCPAAVRHEVSRALTQLYGGDPGAVDPHQSGRLAGFTNRKPRHEAARGFPFVLLLNAPGRPAKKAPALIEQAEAVIATKPDKARMIPDIASGTIDPDLETAWLEEYRRGASEDLSAVDWSMVNRLLSAGTDPDVITAVLASVATRKGKSAEKYATRTVSNALVRRESPSP